MIELMDANQIRRIVLTGLIKTKIHQHADVMSLPSYWGSKCGVVNHYPSLRGNISVSQRLNVTIKFIADFLTCSSPLI